MQPTKKIAGVPQPGGGRTGDRPSDNANTADAVPLKGTLDLGLNTGVAPGPRYSFNPRDALMRLRLRFPNLQIIPIPQNTVTRLLAASVAQDMTLPDGTLAILFFSTAPFWLNFDGAAAVPTANSAENRSTSIFIPTDFPYMFYIFGKRQFSVLMEQAGTVHAYCYVDLPMEQN